MNMVSERADRGGGRDNQGGKTQAYPHSADLVSNVLQNPDLNHALVVKSFLVANDFHCTVTLSLVIVHLDHLHASDGDKHPGEERGRKEGRIQGQIE